MLLRSFWLHPPSGPREGCDAFHDFDAASSRKALPVEVADHGRSLGAAGPVAAGPVLAGRECPAIGLRAGEDVVVVRRGGAVRHHRPTLGQRRAG